MENGEEDLEPLDDLDLGLEFGDLLGFENHKGDYVSMEFSWDVPAPRDVEDDFISLDKQLPVRDKDNMEGNAEQETSLNIDGSDADNDTVQINDVIVEDVNHNIKLLWYIGKEPLGIT